MDRFLHFLQYHNAVPIALGIVMLGGGVTFAATNPEAIYSAEQQVISIDNTYIAEKDLSAYTPTIEITGVTEDADNYYVAYKLSTIDLTESVWKDVVKGETITVSKIDLGPYRDLGIYVTQQLKQTIDREEARLVGTQEIEKKNLSQKVVATLYGGLVGKLLNDSTEVLPGYIPVVQEPNAPEQIAAAASAQTPSNNASPAIQSGAPSGNPSLRIQLLGNNPAQIPLRTTYIDLGAIVTDAANDNLGIHTFLNGKEVTQIQIDTSTTSVSTIRYTSTDPQGNSTSIERTVYVYDPAIGPPVPESQVQALSPLPEPTPEPAPEPTPPEPTP